MKSESKVETGEKQFNRLKGEKSPYLLQHADNPVDWYPWGPEAFEKACKEKKTNFSLHWVLILSLVPCNGTRVF